MILYSVNWEVKGVALDGKAGTALGPLSRVAMATHLAALASQDLVLWADGDQGRVTRIHRDGTGRSHVLDRPETMEATAGDLIAGLAVDWIAGGFMQLGTVGRLSHTPNSCLNFLLPFVSSIYQT